MKSTIDMAREAGIDFQRNVGLLGRENISTTGSQTLEKIERLVALVRADECEQAEERVTDLFANMETPYLPDIAAAIRARGQQ